MDGVCGAHVELMTGVFIKGFYIDEKKLVFDVKIFRLPIEIHYHIDIDEYLTRILIPNC